MNKGFTLIELLVSIFIITLLTSLFLINLRGGEKQYLLDRVAQKLTQDIHRVQNLSLSPEEFNTEKPLSFKIGFDKPDNQYSLIAELPVAGDFNIETVQIEGGVIISELSTGNSLDITFTPPNPTIEISGGGAEALIVLELESDSSKTKTIRVNTVGLVEIQ